MINVGGYLEYRGGCSVPWGNVMSTVGDYLGYRGGCSVPCWEVMMHLGDIMSTVEGVQYHRRKSLLLFQYSFFATAVSIN